MTWPLGTNAFRVAVGIVAAGVPEPKLRNMPIELPEDFAKVRDAVLGALD